MKQPIIAECKNIARVAALIWSKNWAEGSSGNISCRLDGIDFKAGEESFIYEIGGGVPALEASRILLTSTGSRFRMMSPERDFALVEIGARSIRQIWGEKRITSEWKCHLLLHDLLAARGDESRIIMHAHLPGMIALTHIISSEKELFAKLALVLHEIKIFFPEGIGLVDLKPTGSEELARATREQASRHNLVVWKAHGVIAFGSDYDQIFDYFEMIENAAAILLRIMSLRDIPPSFAEKKTGGRK